MPGDDPESSDTGTRISLQSNGGVLVFCKQRAGNSSLHSNGDVMSSINHDNNILGLRYISVSCARYTHDMFDNFNCHQV